ncbi:cytochrome c oxidase subunit II [Coralloluteibacterium stylophorae]|uniref:Cytochrome c oxidase subunit 2 n=1 Tax=Coralloluteibacterium stylophorae TaxID=1776034 RepID=A0A8J8AW78_9GAMM|nr:cytochrome c oxidase subunit II [Coralloluteibacterium stylophorae]MBS7456392.1 cytochrome c oxidase subunit II [Coralloluteibacterium stylophorae]
MNRWLFGASSIAGDLDLLFGFMTLLSGIVAIGVFAAIWYFCIRYRRGHETTRTLPRRGDLPVELTWTIIPLLLFLGVFIWSIRLYARIETVPDGAMPVYIVAKQWMWKAQHAGGRREINVLHVPVGRPVQLNMISEDVIHSFFVPAFRVKQDVLPGRYTQLWFEVEEPGEYDLLCAEYCGTEHSGMRGTVVALQPEAFARWLAGGGDVADLATRGAALFRRHGCSGCHAPESRVHAPDLAGLPGRPVQLADGSRTVADDAYLRDSILLPTRQVVAGYEPIMPSFAGQLDEEDLLALIAYLNSLERRPGAAEMPP